MVFSSIHFLLYFLPVFLLLYFASPAKWKNTLALLASCFFYMWGAPEFFFIILTSIIFDFYLVQLTRYSTGKLRKRLLILTILLDVAILLVAKYLNFFVENINVTAGWFELGGIDMRSIVLPIGISFITFQKISYVVDCYQGRTEPLKKLGDYALYILLFPQLIAGPIVRFNEIADQLRDRRAHENIDYKLSGLLRFIIGLAKKVLIANTLGEVADQAFALQGDQLSSAAAWLGIIAYSFQIYFDFAGYSDMAIGIAKMIGFRFPENFNFPYISTSITEFWRRWHITLSRWMRDYLYIPLGGNRVSEARLYANLSAVFLISGLWHGAAWSFVFWGAFHGFFLVLDRLFLLRFLNRIGRLPAILLTYLIVLVGWVFFRANSFAYAWDYLLSMLAFDFSRPGLFVENTFWLALAVAVLGSFAAVFPALEFKLVRWHSQTSNIYNLSFRLAVSAVLGLWCVTEIFSSDFNPFIYFKF